MVKKVAALQAKRSRIMPEKYGLANRPMKYFQELI
jgi:hypothetical protein